MKTALYERLSNDDDLPGESLSILHQQEYLENYAAKHGFIPFSHYSDDGYTGTNFQRPAFQSMLKEIEKGEIDTVIVRDLSRFGRNYREAGFYLEKVFPTYHVRFIAVMNQVDTEKNRDDFSVPLFNMINDWYSRDLSRRLKNTFRHRDQTGRRTSAAPRYGFVCEPDQRNDWQIDEVAAEAIRIVYRLYLSGDSLTQAAQHLTEKNILIPNDYYLVRGWTSRHLWRHQIQHQWTESTVKDFVSNEEYMGTMVLGKSTQPCSYKNAHSAIISPENWQILQKRRKILVPTGVPDIPPVFYCNHCHQRMYLNHNTEGLRYLRCQNHLCKPGRTLSYPAIREICRILEETLWNSIPDKKRLQRKARTIRQKNALRKEKASREFHSLLDDRLYYVSQQMIKLYESDMEEPNRSRLLSAYQEERELILKAQSVSKPEEPSPLSSAFLRCIYAFVDRIEVTARSRNTQCILIHLATSIPQPPPRQIQTCTIHFIPGKSKSPSSHILQLLQDDLL